MSIITFKTWLKEDSIVVSENFGEEHDFSGLKPYHNFKTNDGHQIDVHVFNNEHGKHAVFYNKNLKGITKLVHWSSGNPTKKELELAGHDERKEEDLNENYLIEKWGPDAAGKIAEHSAVMHMIGIMHKQKGTYNTAQHKKDIAPHKQAIKHHGEGASAQEIGLRIRHGAEMAHAAHESLKLKHGPNVKIVRVGHTSKPGDIAKFTKGKHKDTQDNPSDMTVEVRVPKKLKEDSNQNDTHHFEGFSLKSSAKSKNITTKNPGIDFDGSLDHHTRKLKTRAISSKGARETHEKIGLSGTTPSERRNVMHKHREKEGVSSGSKIEKKANEHNHIVHGKIAKELHNHIKHLTTKSGDEGHHLVGKMLEKHLVPKTSMSCSKIHVKGIHEHNIHATVTPISDHPLNKVLRSKKTKYASSISGNTVTIHKVEKDGSHTPLAHYRPRTGGSEAMVSTGHKWDVRMANTHSKK